MQDITGYGYYHLEGRDSPTYMPVRDWAYVSDEAMDEIENEFANFVTEPFQ